MGKVGTLQVPKLGYGLMGISTAYKGIMKDEDALELLTKAADAGITFWDTSDVYGPHTNEQLLGQWFTKTGRRKEITLATKFGISISEKGIGIDGSAAYVKKACNDSLKRLQTDYIDLYYQHRVDQNTPIEVTVGAMAELVKEGKVRNLGLSEASAKTLARAQKVHPIAATQVEYSPFALEIEHNDVLRVARQQGTAIICYSPLGRGMLSGKFTSPDDFPEGDFRKTSPRFQGENFKQNMKLVDAIDAIAKKKSCTPGQLTLAWLCAQGPDVIPIPGTTKWENLMENWDSRNVTLSPGEIAEIRKIVDAADVAGDRNVELLTSLEYLDTPEK